MRMGQFAHAIWRHYPGSRIRVDVTEAGVNSYCVKLTLLNVRLEPIQVIEHYGSGSLDVIKKEAVQKLAASLNASAS